MPEKEQLIAEIYQTLLTSLNQAKDFAAEQMPLVIQEYLKWYLYESIFWLGVGAVVLIVGAFLFRLGVKLYNPDHFDNDGSIGVGAIGAAMAVFVACPMILINTYSIIKVTAAPRVVLLEYLSTLVK